MKDLLDTIIKIVFTILIFVSGYMAGGKLAKEERTPIATAKDTTISGMRYVIWVEPRTGDLSVVNATIDSIKVTMFNNQLK